MARETESTPQLRVMYALHQSRKYRHHKTCQCGMYSRFYCSAADEMWQQTLNRELDALGKP